MKRIWRAFHPEEKKQIIIVLILGIACLITGILVGIVIISKKTEELPSGSKTVAQKKKEASQKTKKEIEQATSLEKNKEPSKNILYWAGSPEKGQSLFINENLPKVLFYGKKDITKIEEADYLINNAKINEKDKKLFLKNLNNQITEKVFNKYLKENAFIVGNNIYIPTKSSMLQIQIIKPVRNSKIKSISRAIRKRDD